MNSQPMTIKDARLIFGQRLLFGNVECITARTIIGMAQDLELLDGLSPASNKRTSVPCHECDGEGDCPCCGEGSCPTCRGQGEITEIMSASRIDRIEQEELESMWVRWNDAQDERIAA